MEENIHINEEGFDEEALDEEEFDQKAWEAPRAVFLADGREKIAAMLMYAVAYIYMTMMDLDHGSIQRWPMGLFVATFLLVMEYLYWERPRKAESWVLSGCIVAMTAGFLLRDGGAWGEANCFLLLHPIIIYYAMVRGGVLTEGKSGHFLPIDLIYGAFGLPFYHFLLRIRTVKCAVLDAVSQRGRHSARQVGYSLAAAAVGAVLLIAAVALLTRADDAFARLTQGFAGLFQNTSFDLFPVYFIASLPVGAYLYGLIGGAYRTEEKIELRRDVLADLLRRIRVVPGRPWAWIACAFCLVYLLFFATQAQYLFGAFFRRLPEGFIVSQYARQGFFELCWVMAINFLLLWCMTRTSARGISDRRVKITASALLIESVVFAVIAMSKLALYIDCFGFTPLRLQSVWLICVLLTGCVCWIVNILTGKAVCRTWLMFCAVTMAALAML